MTVAITGGTGFVGQHVIRIAAERGVAVRALARRKQADVAGVTWIEGDLERPAALASLCTGADAVIHIAGLINARTRAEFDHCNVTGTQAMIDAARAAGARRFVHVSSLAAREPGLSVYGASKAVSETLLPSSGLDWAIVRPPAVYGEGDRETLELFKMVAKGVALLPPRGRASFIEVTDLARLLLALATGGPSGVTLEPDDGAPGGYAHDHIARTIGKALGRDPLIVRAPRFAMTAAAGIATLWGKVTGGLPKLSFDRARYLAHEDWVSRQPVDAAVWGPEIALDAGMARTAEWYRAKGWL